MVDLTFTETADVGEFQCNLCNIIRKKGNGNTNLLTHLETSHRDNIKDFIKANQCTRKGPIHAHVRNLSQDAKDYHDWIEWVVMGDHPFTFVENKYTRQNSRMNSISRPTLRDYMELVSYTLTRNTESYLPRNVQVLKETKASILEELPELFGTVISSFWFSVVLPDYLR